jgi:hypothetical protein
MSYLRSLCFKRHIILFKRSAFKVNLIRFVNFGIKIDKFHIAN